ncbi:MAG: hypothetical protein MJ071_05925 [Oscillospiraceae bacterium]|nr:hypothetical protein [Oscillospiraceae bacterium]
MKENIVPSYLPAAAVTLEKKDTGETATLYRPYEAFPMDTLIQHGEQNECGALLQLGQRYHFGVLGAEQDYDKAYACLKKAAELGAQDAQALLALYYILDEPGILPHDAAQFVKMLTLAAENGSWRAMEALSNGYREGSEGFSVDHEKAFAWAVQAERMLKFYWAFYDRPDFVDFKELQKEILMSHSRISLLLSRYCGDGIGTKRNLQKAMEWTISGEAFVCSITGLAKVPMFQERRKQLQERMQKEEQRARNKEKHAKKKK